MKKHFPENLDEWLIVAEFNEQFSHIGVDDHCYVLLNGGKISPWWTKEASEALRKLPTDPNLAKPIKVKAKLKAKLK